MGSTVGARYATGKVLAVSGADVDVRVVDFKPSKVVIQNEVSLAKLDFNDSQDDGEGWKTVAAGTRTLQSTLGITLLDGISTEPPGFRIGQMVDINDTDDETLQWEAWG